MKNETLKKANELQKECERYLNDKPKDTSYHVFIKSLILAGFIIAVLFGMIIICAIQLLKQ